MQERLERIKQHMRSMHVLDMRQLTMASDEYNPHASSESAWERHAISVQTLNRGYNTTDARSGGSSNRSARTSGSSFGGGSGTVPTGSSSNVAPPTFLRGQMRLKSIKGPSKLMKGLSLAFRDVTAGSGGVGSARGLELLLGGDRGDEEGEDEYYDEMEYGDELNDAEEKDYKKTRKEEISN